jgi:hypothetical protein
VAYPLTKKALAPWAQSPAKTAKLFVKKRFEIVIDHGTPPKKG